MVEYALENLAGILELSYHFRETFKALEEVLGINFVSLTNVMQISDVFISDLFNGRELPEDLTQKEFDDVDVLHYIIFAF